VQQIEEQKTGCGMPHKHCGKVSWIASLFLLTSPAMARLQVPLSRNGSHKQTTKQYWAEARSRSNVILAGESETERALWAMGNRSSVVAYGRGATVPRLSGIFLEYRGMRCNIGKVVTRTFQHWELTNYMELSTTREATW
jgi:hypothetical protein